MTTCPDSIQTNDYMPSFDSRRKIESAIEAFRSKEILLDRDIKTYMSKISEWCLF